MNHASTPQSKHSPTNGRSFSIADLGTLATALGLSLTLLYQIVGSQAYTQLLALCVASLLLAYSALRSQITSDIPKCSTLLTALVALFVWRVISDLATGIQLTEIPNAGSQLTALLILLSMASLTRTGKFHRQHLERIILTALLAISVVYLLSRYIGSQPLPNLNPNLVGSFIAALLFFPIVRIIFSDSPKKHLLAWASLTSGLMALAQTRSRGVAMVVVLVLVFTHMNSLRHRRKQLTPLFRNILLLLSAATLGVLATALLGSGVDLKGSLAVRLEILANTWQMILDHPLFGVGAGQFDDAYLIYAKQHTSYLVAAFAHNDYIQLIAEHGLPTLLFIACFLWALLKRLASPALWTDQRFLSCGAGLGCLLLLLHAAIDFPLHIPSHQLLLAFLLGLFIMERPRARNTSRLESAPLRLLVFFVVLIVATPWMVTAATMSMSPSEQLANYRFTANVQAHSHNRVLQLIDQNRIEDALQLARFGEVLNEDRTSAYSLARVWIEKREFEKAEKALLVLISRDPNNVVNLELLAETYLASNRDQKALAVYTTIVKSDTSRLPETLRSLFKKFNNPLLIQSIVPEDPKSQLVFVDYLLLNKNYVATVATLITYFESKETCDQKLNGVLSQLVQQRANLEFTPLDTLLAKASKACASNPSDAQLLNGHRDQLHGRSILALEHYEKALIADPHNSYALMHGINIAQTKRQFEIDWNLRLDRVLKAHPDQPELIYRKAITEQRLGQWQNAVDRARFLSHNYLREARYKRLLGDLYFDRQIYSQFFRIYRDLIKQNPNDIGALLTLAAAYRKLELVDEERATLERAHLLDKGNRVIIDRLKQLK